MGNSKPQQQACRQVSEKERPSVLGNLKNPPRVGVETKEKQNKYVEVR
jgi:hypothetical protein